MSFFNQRFTNYISRKKLPTSVYDFENSMRLKRGLKPEAFVSIPMTENSQNEEKTLQEVIDEGKENTNWRYVKIRRSEGPKYLMFFAWTCLLFSYKVVRVVDNTQHGQRKHESNKAGQDHEISDRHFQDKLE